MRRVLTLAIAFAMTAGIGQLIAAQNPPATPPAQQQPATPPPADISAPAPATAQAETARVKTMEGELTNVDPDKKDRKSVV